MNTRGKFAQIILGLFISCFLIFGITSCEPAANPSSSSGIEYLSAVNGVPDTFTGTWENNDYGYHSEYTLTKSQIKDVSMNVEYNVVSDTTVTSADGCTMIFCQIAEGKGTQYTPAGNFYVVAVNKTGSQLKICCPADYASVYKSLEELQLKYTSSYNIANNGNYFTTCDSVPAYRPLKEGVPDSFVGTWDDSQYGSQYVLTKKTIEDKMMSVTYNVVSDTTVTSADGCTMIFCQIAEGKGTQWTPEGNYYVVAVKMNGTQLDISCPIDYSSVYTKLYQLQTKYIATYNVSGNNNWFTTCDKQNLNSNQSITLTDSTGYCTQVKFEKTKVTLLMMGADGWGEYTSFTPARDTSKENASTLLYLYSSADRTYSSDLHYMKIKSNNSIFWYRYDDEEEYTDTVIDSCNSYMPTVTSEQLAQIKALYE